MKNNNSLIILLLFNILALVLYYFDTEYNFLGDIGRGTLCIFPCLYNIYYLRKLFLTKTP